MGEETALRCPPHAFGASAFVPLRRRPVLDCCRAPHADIHLYARPEPVDDRDEAIDGKAREVALRIRRSRRQRSRCPCAARTLRPSRSSALMISAARIALDCSASALWCPRSRKIFPLPAPLPAFRSSSQHLLQPFHSVPYQIDRAFRRLDALRRFLLKAWTTQMSSASCTAYTTRNASQRNGNAISNTPEPIPTVKGNRLRRITRVSRYSAARNVEGRPQSYQSACFGEPRRNSDRTRNNSALPATLDSSGHL